jgi:hypothetical protein
MSAINGDKARFNRFRRKKIQRRERLHAMLGTSANLAGQETGKPKARTKENKS